MFNSNTTEKTIEGDLFNAFVEAGAISKANATDPKKSALVRCARTDKGVHAAGNVISLKLIIEDKDIIEKINSHLSPQIRVWGIERTVNSFSCYQACDSRWYEYLIPTHSFLPPHPSSFLGRKLVQHAQEAGDEEGYKKRQEEVANFWEETEEKHIKPILDTLQEPIKSLVMRALYEDEVEEHLTESAEPQACNKAPEEKPEVSTTAANQPDMVVQKVEVPETEAAANTATSNGEADGKPESEAKIEDVDKVEAPEESSSELEHKKNLEATIKQIRTAYSTAKRAWRISNARKDRVAEALKPFLGTRNYHNFTVEKTFGDASSKRHIKSFTLRPEPIIINGTEWLSIKIHGQSFMMHQIRKMISMIALTVRCGCPPERILEAFGQTTISIPKVPGLGLLLERPVFDSYNEGAATKFERGKIDFGKYEKELEEFKQKEIYERIFREEADGNAFNTFFAHVDSFREAQFLYLTSKGLDAIKGLATTRGKGKQDVPKSSGVDSEDEGGNAGDS